MKKTKKTKKKVPPAPVVETQMTLTQFKKRFKDEIKETTEWLWREDKEMVFTRVTVKAEALRTVLENHEEIEITD